MERKGRESEERKKELERKRRREKADEKQRRLRTCRRDDHTRHVFS